jgi:deoxyhypusine monooxygenase
LGAIADPTTLPELEKFAQDPTPEVAETCQIAASRVRWAIENGVAGSADNAKGKEGNLHDNPFESVDPAPADKKPLNADIPKYQQTLTDQTVPLFDRYKAMFSLRNNGSKAAVLALCLGLKDPSPLFRHEVAYVLGQLAHPASSSALMDSVTDGAEHEMVRHEAAEALGAIGTSDCVEFLEKYVDSPALMLKESCVVALDAADYFNTFGKAEGEAEAAA